MSTGTFILFLITFALLIAGLILTLQKFHHRPFFSGFLFSFRNRDKRG